MAGTTDRSFLLLQGPVGPFFALLARRLQGHGHRASRILFNGGDSLFSRAAGAVSYRGDLAGWPAFLEAQLRAQAVTDIVLFGDCRPLHREAVLQARALGITVHVLEEGYLRPHWLTLEVGGVNGYSALPRSPEWYLAQARGLPAWHAPHPVIDSFAFRALVNVLYQLATLICTRHYPGYRTHRPWHPLAEYGAATRASLASIFVRWRSARRAGRMVAQARPWYLFPLQLESDSQIRFHSAAGSLLPVIEQVVGSFARQAPAGTLLAVTEHPLDTGIVDLKRATRDAAERHGIGERVVYLRGGSPTELLRQCRGVVTVNSTIGFRALNLKRPLKPLGWAIYDMPGLSFQGSLDEFWQHGTAPDATLFEAFCRVLTARTQLNAGLYSPGALRRAADGVAARLFTSAASESPASVR